MRTTKMSARDVLLVVLSGALFAGAGGLVAYAFWILVSWFKSLPPGPITYASANRALLAQMGKLFTGAAQFGIWAVVMVAIIVLKAH